MSDSSVISGRPWPLAAVAIDHIREALNCSDHKARLELQIALQDGAVHARGPLHGTKAEPVPSEFWRFAFPDENGSAFDIDDLHGLAWFEVRAAEVLARWPSGRTIEGEIVTEQQALAGRKSFTQPKTGPRPDKIEAVKQVMRDRIATGKITPKSLQEMPRKALPALVGDIAKETCCYAARRAVLAECN